MKAYSLDLRQKILRACDAGLGSQRAIAHLFGVSQSFLEKLLRRRRTSGTMAALPHGGGRTPACDTATLALVRGFVQQQPDATLEELCERLHAPRGLRVSVPTMCRLWYRLGLPRKKKPSTRLSVRPHGSNRRVSVTGSGSPRLMCGA